MAEYKVTFPQLGNYHVALEVLFTAGLDVTYITPPPITRHTLELGSRHSPEFVCAPFKYCLGNYLEAIEAGANTLIQAGGDCRLGFYGELHEQILLDLGYTVRFINMARTRRTKPLTFYNALKDINPQMSLKKIAGILPVTLKMVTYIDEIEDFNRQNVGFEVVPGSFAQAHQDFLASLRTVRSRQALEDVYTQGKDRLKNIAVDKPKNPLRVGIVGEYYTIMEPFSNHFLEKELAEMGIVVVRWMNVSNTLLHNQNARIREHIRSYVKYPMGATSMATIDQALRFAKEKYDGIIHVKSFGCTPEMDAMPVLQNISADYKIPILYFSFDTQTSETGVRTRLEAFYDMIMMRKDAKK